MVRRPVSASASISSILRAVGMTCFSNWKPSRGPSSTISTVLGRSAIAISSFDGGLRAALAAGVPDLEEDREREHGDHQHPQNPGDRTRDQNAPVAVADRERTPQIGLHDGAEQEPEHHGHERNVEFAEYVAEQA